MRRLQRVARVVTAVALFLLVVCVVAGRAEAQSPEQFPPATSLPTEAVPPAAPLAEPGAVEPAPDGGGDGGAGFFDVAGRMREAVVGLLEDLAIAVLEPALALLGRTVLATPDVTTWPRVRELWVATAAVTNGVFVLLVLVGGGVVMGHETVQTRFAAKDLLGRLVLSVLAANASLLVVGQLCRISSALAGAVLGDATATDTAGLRDAVLGRITGSVALVMLAVVAAGLALAVVATYVVRVGVLLVLVAAAPLVLASHALPMADGLARRWWRSLAACCAVPVAQAFAVAAVVRVVLSTGGGSSLGLGAGGALIDALVVACLLWLLVRIPVWGARLVFAEGGRSVTTVVRTAALAVAK